MVWLGGVCVSVVIGVVDLDKTSCVFQQLDLRKKYETCGK